MKKISTVILSFCLFIIFGGAKPLCSGDWDDYTDDDSSDEEYTSHRLATKAPVLDTDSLKLYKDLPPAELSRICYNLGLERLYADNVNALYYREKRNLNKGDGSKSIRIDQKMRRDFLEKKIKEFINGAGLDVFLPPSPGSKQAQWQAFFDPILEALGPCDGVNDSGIGKHEPDGEIEGAAQAASGFDILAKARVGLRNFTGDRGTQIKKSLGPVRDALRNALCEQLAWPNPPTQDRLWEDPNLLDMIYEEFSNSLHEEICEIYQQAGYLKGHVLSTGKGSRQFENPPQTNFPESFKLLSKHINSLNRNKCLANALKEASEASGNEGLLKAFYNDLKNKAATGARDGNQIWPFGWYLEKLRIDKGKAYKAVPEKYKGNFPQGLNEQIRKLAGEKFDAFFEALLVQRWDVAVQTRRPVLPAENVFVHGRRAEFLKNIRLAHRSLKRRLRNLQNDPTVAVLFEKRNGTILVDQVTTRWQFGDVYVQDQQKIKADGSFEHMVMLLGTYDDISASIKKDFPTSTKEKWLAAAVMEAISTGSITGGTKDERHMAARLAYLLVGCEGVRYPGALITAPMALQLIREEKISWEQALKWLPMCMGGAVGITRGMINQHQNSAVLPYSRGENKSSKKDVQSFRENEKKIVDLWINCKDKPSNFGRLNRVAFLSLLYRHHPLLASTPRKPLKPKTS